MLPFVPRSCEREPVHTQVHKTGPVFGKLACLLLMVDLLLACLLTWLFPASFIDAAADYTPPSPSTPRQQLREKPLQNGDATRWAEL